MTQPRSGARDPAGGCPSRSFDAGIRKYPLRNRLRVSKNQVIGSAPNAETELIPGIGFAAVVERRSHEWL